MGLYYNAKRITSMFCTAIICVTIGMLALRLTVFSDMAVTASAKEPQGGSDIQADGINGDNDFPYKLNSKIYFSKPDSKGNFLILNPETNEYLLSINILLPETKESLYYTGAITPGTSIDSDKLSAAGQKLSDGVYECIAEIYAIDPVEMTRVDGEKKPVTLYIGEKPLP